MTIAFIKSQLIKNQGVLMKKTIAVLIIFAITCVAFAAWQTGEKEVRVQLPDAQAYKTLKSLNLPGEVYPNGSALCYVTAAEQARLDASGLSYTVEKSDLKAFSQGFWNSDVPNGYYETTEITAIADSLVNAFPNIVSKHVFGYNPQNYELAALKISDNPNDDEFEAEVMFDAGIHGDEVGGPENAIRFARYICQNYGVDPTITNLIDNREIWIYYMVNPYGRDNMTRYNSAGVDLNRDWGYMWDGEGSSTGPYSQVESRALRDCVYQRNFVVHTTYHSGTEYISCPWSYRASQCPDFDHILQLAGVYSSTSTYSNMQYGQGCTGMYPINGSSKDSNYGAWGAISWSMEISYSKQPPASQVMMYYNHNVPAMMAMIEYAGYGLQGTVTDATTGDPIPAVIFVNDYMPAYTDVVAGDYHKYVLPGTYSITVMANGYESQTINNIAVTANSATTTNFQLQPADGQFAYKVVSCRIPNNNTADEGDTPGIIGAPDSRNYSIGKNGYIVFDMGAPIADGPGNDIKIFEGDTSPEGYTLYAGETMDGPWHSLGTGTGTSEFDIAQGNVIEAQFFKVQDDGDGTANAADAGFDLDAIAALESVSGVYIGVMDVVIDDSAANGNGRIDPGETVDLQVTLRNNGDIAANSTTGDLSTTSPYLTLVAANASFGSIAAGQTATATFTLTASDTTPAGQDVQLTLDVTANAGAYTNAFSMEFSVGGYLIEEYFDAFPPAGWTTIGGSNWQGSSSNNAGGAAPEAHFYWSPSTNGIQRLVSDEINTSGATELTYEFKHYLDDYSGGYEIRVETTSDGQNWNTVWSQTPTGNIGPETVDGSITNGDVGSPTFQIAWVFDGNSFNLDHWYVDDVLLGGASGNPTTGVIAGVVTLDGGTGSLTDVEVTCDGTTINPAANGTFSFVLDPGNYSVNATCTGYDPVTLNNLQVTAGQTTNADITLTWLGGNTNPAQNLTATIAEYNNVDLAWDAPAAEREISGFSASSNKKTTSAIDQTRALSGYKVYRDGAMIEQISNPATLSYTDADLDAGDYEYYVVAVYDEGEAVPSNTAGVTIILPAPTGFNAVSQGPASSSVLCSWSAPTDSRNLTDYTIYRDGAEIGVTTSLTYEDTNVPTGEYTYHVTALYSDQYESVASNSVTVQHTDAPAPLVPTATALVGNYPNPFNPTTEVRFSLIETADVQIEIYNVRGEKVKTLVDDRFDAAYHTVTWNGDDDTGRAAGSGIYFYKMRAGKFTSTKKMILMK
jgi:hypothetical protein